MRNVAKIQLELKKCTECPYCNHPENSSTFYCAHDLKNPGLDVGDGTEIPDFCPFVLLRIENVLNQIRESNCYSIPKKYVTQIERKQRDDPNPKFGADHAWDHIRRVSEIGTKFLGDCVQYGYVSPDTVQKESLLLQIAAALHDIGLADSSRNHANHSAEMARKYFLNKKIDIDAFDADVIVHAISNHSNGTETRTNVDAALVLADKLDVTSKRIVRVTDRITAELIKVKTVDYELVGDNGHADSAVLRYETDESFNIQALRCWPKCVSVPMHITVEYLKIPKFEFLVNGKKIDVKEIIG